MAKRSGAVAKLKEKNANVKDVQEYEQLTDKQKAEHKLVDNFYVPKGQGDLELPPVNGRARKMLI